MKQFIKDLWLILVERHKIHKALRILVKQEWSIEFLIALLNKAAEAKRQNVYFVLRNKDGKEIQINAHTPNLGTVSSREIELDRMNEQGRLNALLDAAEMDGVL